MGGSYWKRPRGAFDKGSLKVVSLEGDSYAQASLRKTDLQGTEALFLLMIVLYVQVLSPKSHKLS